MEFKVLEGLTVTEVLGLEQDSEEVIFKTKCGQTYKLYHEQDCCEWVYVSDVCGDLADLEDSLILTAREDSGEMVDVDESGTWTFYNIQTNKGSVQIRWNGESNGYYSESVDFIKVS